jgi:hypothetical protein
VLLGLIGFGLYRRDWQGAQVLEDRARLIAELPELGFFDAEHFRPHTWRPLLKNPAFEMATPRDRYWGTKRVIAFSREEVRAAIDTGRYRPLARERLMDILWRRRERIARTYLAEAAALDYFRVDGEELCFDDLWLQAGLGGATTTRYQVRGAGPVAARDTVERCVKLPHAGGYRIVELRTRRPGERHFGPAVRVHLIADRIVGVER